MTMTMLKSAALMLGLSTAFTALMGVSHPAAASVPDEAAQQAQLSELAGLLQFADNDSDEDQPGAKSDDDEGGCVGGGGDDDEGEDDDEGGCAQGKAPAAAGTAPPPANGLIVPGSKPAVKIN